MYPARWKRKKAMAQLVSLLIFFGILVVLIVVGTRLNMYLFSQGVLGSSRYSRVHPIGSVAAATDRPNAEQRFYRSNGDDEDQTTRYARNGMVFLTVALFVVLISAIFLLIAPH
jgi:hypothetical protein